MISISNNSQDFIKKLQRERTDYNHASQVRMQAKSLLQLSVGIYTEPERFVYELLQNAVDAFADTGNDTLNILIKAEDDRFIFMHNGRAFDEKDVEGICDVGNGTKANDIKKIGYKGIGFKSVFMPKVERVSIISGGFCFEFDKQKAISLMPSFPPSEGGLEPNDVPWQVIPIVAPDLQELSEPGFNVITIVYSQEVAAIASKIENLFSDLQFLLFLSSNNVNIWFERNGQHVLSVGKEQTDNNGTISIVTLNKNGRSQSSWMLYTKDVPVPLDVKSALENDFNTPDKLKGAGQVEISFAVQINGDKVVPLKNTSVFTFLPTSYRGLREPFLINSNFITDAGRQHLHQESEWNKLIFNKIPELYLDFVSKFSQKYSNYTEVLPTIYPDNDTLVRVYRNALQNAFDSIAFVPNRNGNCLLKIGEVLVDRTGVSKGIVPVDRMLNHINNKNNSHFTDDSFVENEGIVSYAYNKVTIFKSDNLIQLLNDPLIIEGLTTTDDVELIQFLCHYCCELKDLSEKSNFEEELKHCPFLKDEDEKWNCPVNIYLPSDFKEQNQQAEGVRLLNDIVFSGVKNNAQILSWLRDSMEMKELDDLGFIDYVFTHPDYVTKLNAIAVAAFLFRVWLNTPRVIEDNPRKWTFKLLTKSGDLKNACDLFLTEDYEPKIILDDVVGNELFPSTDYCHFGAMSKVKMFLLVLGVNEDVALRQMSLEVSSFSNRFDSSFFKKVVETSQKWGNTYSGFKIGGHYTFMPSIILYYSYPLLEMARNHKLSKILFERILSRPAPDTNLDVVVQGWCGFFQRSKNLKFLASADVGCPTNYLEWVIENCPVLPTSLGDCRNAREIFAYNAKTYSIAGKYLPVLEAGKIAINDSWRQKLPFKQTLSTCDLLFILEKVSNDTEADREQVKDSVSAIYREIIERGVQCSADLAFWAKTHKILSKSGVFRATSELTYITVDGFQDNGNKVYCEKLGKENRDKMIQMLKTFGVRVITQEDVSTTFKNANENDELKTRLLDKLQYLAILRGNGKMDFEKNKLELESKIHNTHFFKCDSISLSYGEENDTLIKSTFSKGDCFYYTGKITPALMEPLLSSLCSRLNLGNNNDGKLMVILITEDHQSLVDYLADCGYDVSCLIPPKVQCVEQPVENKNVRAVQVIETPVGDGLVNEPGDVSKQGQEEINKEVRIYAKQYLAANGYDVSEWNAESSGPDLEGVIKDSQGNPINVVIRSAKQQYIYLSASSFEILMSNPNNLLIVENHQGIRTVTFEELFGNDSNVNLIFDARHTPREYFQALAIIFKYVKNTRFVVRDPHFSAYEEIKGFGLEVKNDGPILISSLDNI